MDAIDGDEGMASLQDRFQHLARLIASERFLKMQGLGNEAPFFICPFPAHEAVAMEQMVRQLANRLNQNGVRVLAINLYDLCVELLQERGIWELVLETEPTVSKAELKELWWTHFAAPEAVPMPRVYYELIVDALADLHSQFWDCPRFQPEISALASNVPTSMADRLASFQPVAECLVVRLGMHSGRLRRPRL